MAKQKKIEAEDAIIIAPEVPQLKTGQQIITKPGIYNISIEDYHADKTWNSATGLKHARRSMAEYRLFLDGYWDDNTASHFDYGNSVELFLIDPKGFLEKVAIAPTHKWVEDALAENPKLVNPKASAVYKKLAAQFYEANSEKYIIDEIGEKESYQSLQVQAARCFADKYIQQMFVDIDYQSSCYWIDKETGLQMKCRPDIVKKDRTGGNHNTVINMKTMLDASPNAFAMKVVEYDWPLQACVEIEGVLQSGLLDQVDHYFWLALEKDAPFNVQLYEFNASDLEVLRDEYHYLLNNIKKCKDADVWPGYGAIADNDYGILSVTLPPWYKLNSNR